MLSATQSSHPAQWWRTLQRPSAHTATQHPPIYHKVPTLPHCALMLGCWDNAGTTWHACWQRGLCVPGVRRCGTSTNLVHEFAIIQGELKNSCTSDWTQGLWKLHSWPFFFKSNRDRFSLNCWVAQAGWKHKSLLPQPRECWDTDTLPWSD